MLLAPSRASAALPEPRRSHAPSILGLGCAFWGGHRQQAPWGISLPSSRIRGLLVKPCGTRRGARPPENWGLAGKPRPKCQPGSFPCSLTAPQQNLSLRSGYRRAPSGSWPPFRGDESSAPPAPHPAASPPFQKAKPAPSSQKRHAGTRGTRGHAPWAAPSLPGASRCPRCRAGSRRGAICSPLGAV